MVQRHFQRAWGGAGRLRPELPQPGWDLLSFSRLVRRTWRRSTECAEFARLQPCCKGSSSPTLTSVLPDPEATAFIRLRRLRR